MDQLKTFSIIFLLFILCSELSFGQVPPVPNGRRLRTIIDDKYTDGNLLIGATTGEWAFSKTTGKIMDREFSYVTPENDFKQPYIHPDNSGYRWTRPDRWVNHVKNNQQTLRIHGPIGPQCSSWAQNDNRTAAELETNMRAFMQALCQRYNNKDNFEYLDVVNEVVINGVWHKNKPGTGEWENPWYIIGQDTDVYKTPLFIKYAFEIANQYAPNLKLIFNQHEKTIVNSSWNKIKKTILYLRNMGLRVDGIGWQGHLNAGWEKIEGQPEALKDLIDWAHQNDLEFHITEQSIYLTNNSAEAFEAQAETYKAILDIVVEKSKNGKVGWNTWHIDDANGWRGDEFPSMFDNNYKAKPAYYAVQLALETKGDYTTQYNVTFEIKNKYTNKIVEDCQISFKNDTMYSNSNGQATFQTSAGMYNVAAKKRFLRSLEIKNLSVYSDTIFTLLMDTTEIKYDVTFELKDNYLGSNISLVNVEINSVTQTTDNSGKTTFDLSPENYLTGFNKANYFGTENDFQINSDTTFVVELIKSHGTIKFSIKEGNQPINKALVVLGNDSLYTSSLGVCKFNSMQINNTFSYLVEKEYYNSVPGQFLFQTDTTINVQTNKKVANIEFNISTESGSAENAFVVLNADTAWFSKTGKCKLYNVDKNETHIYQVFSNNYPEFSDSVSIAKDTTINVFLLTGLLDVFSVNNLIKIFPNPAKNFINFEYNSEFENVEILNLKGQLLKQIQLKKNTNRINVSELENGYYLFKFRKKNSDELLIRKVIIQK